MKLMQLKQSMGGMMSSMSRMMGVGPEDDVIEQVGGGQGQGIVTCTWCDTESTALSSIQQQHQVWLKQVGDDDGLPHVQQHSGRSCVYFFPHSSAKQLP
jgi:hypothetical protein